MILCYWIVCQNTANHKLKKQKKNNTNDTIAVIDNIRQVNQSLCGPKIRYTNFTYNIYVFFIYTPILLKLSMSR